MTTVGAVVDVLEGIAPLHLAEEWDNVGLLVGSRDADCTTVFLTIDLTAAVLDEAREAGAQLIVAYHPPIFAPLTRVRDTTPKERIVFDAIRQGIAIHSPHTALDAVQGGVNDWLAEGCGPGTVTALVPHAHLPANEACKIVTFAPRDAGDAIRERMCHAGAGRIGDYSFCTFETEGTGTFLGGATTNPAVGERGKLERVPETKLEMVCSRRDVASAIDALRAAHPYDEPPIEIHPLDPRPDQRIGAGRRVILDEPTDLATLSPRLARHLGIDRVRTSADHQAPLTTIGLCAGAGGSLLDAALGSGCDCFFTGEMRYHNVLKAHDHGGAVVLAGHSNTERGFLPRLRERIVTGPIKVQVAVSRCDRYPLA